MRNSVALALVVLSGCSSPAAAPSAAAAPSSAGATTIDAHVATTSLGSFAVKDIDGHDVRLDRYAGKVALVVNVASKCGFTPQYEALEALYKKYETDGFVVLAFPSDQFGHQEPGTEAEIKTFCFSRYSVTFPLFAKIDVNGPAANPLYVWLRTQQPGSFDKNAPGAEKLYAHLERTTPEVLGTDAVKWNFTKFLVDRTGKVVKRFESMQTPESIDPEVRALLAKK